MPYSKRQFTYEPIVNSEENADRLRELGLDPDLLTVTMGPEAVVVRTIELDRVIEPIMSDMAQFNEVYSISA